VNPLHRTWATPCLALLILGAAGCGRHADDSESSPAARPEVVTGSVQSLPFERALDVPGEWKNTTEVTIQAPFDAVVEALAARPGDRVIRGQTLGTWRTWESQAALQGAELLVREARDSSAAREARRALAQARSGVVRVPIAAPVTGSVARRSADAGSRLTSGAELLSIVSDADIVFEARVRSADARDLRRGATATVEDSLGPPRKAVIVSALPSAGSDQATLVWLRPEPAGPPPVLGRFSRAHIRLGAPRLALAVPDSAVVEDDLTGRKRIAVVDSTSHLEWIDVVLGGRQGAWREVSGAGLAAGRRVIVEGQRALEAGTTVRVRP
jgi:RND family efflux transporter MFP subunit